MAATTGHNTVGNTHLEVLTPTSLLVHPKAAQLQISQQWCMPPPPQIRTLSPHAGSLLLLHSCQNDPKPVPNHNHGLQGSMTHAS
jgi:hypothetical protein